MITRADVIAACLAFPDAYEDYPFDDPGWTAMRHRTNHKSFAFICEREEKIWINLKAEPLMADFWKSAFPAVVPAYHMNKNPLGVRNSGWQHDGYANYAIDSGQLCSDTEKRKTVIVHAKAEAKEENCTGGKGLACSAFYSFGYYPCSGFS